MALPLVSALVMVLLVLGYRFYGGFVARQYALDPAASTPATRVNDGVDFVPTKPFYLLGQHFSAIAAAGPIAGPILACQQFGWLPALLWITFGVVFIGAVHDLSTLIASVRHDGKIDRRRGAADQLGPTRRRGDDGLHLGRADLRDRRVHRRHRVDLRVRRSRSSRGSPSPSTPAARSLPRRCSTCCSRVVMGVVDRLWKPPLWLQTVDLRARAPSSWSGSAPSSRPGSSRTRAPGRSLILVYCFVASLTPVWALLQPRGYLGGFVLYLALAVGRDRPLLRRLPDRAAGVQGFQAPGAVGALFPFLFVTIACGACSGFHGLVCSGTTSKQIANERTATRSATARCCSRASSR